MTNNSQQVFAGGWKQLQHAKHINSDVIPGTIAFSTKIVWKPDGTTFLSIDATNPDVVNQYNVTTPYITTGLNLVATFIVNPPEANPRGLEVHPDGTKFWILGSNTEQIHEFHMTAWDLSTATNPGIATNPIALTSPQGFTFVNGTKCYIADGTDDLMEYNMFPPYDLSTFSSEIDKLDISPDSEDPRDIRFHPNGIIFYIPSDLFDCISRYELPFKGSPISTGVFVDKLDISAFMTTPQGMFIRQHDGKRLYVLDTSTDTIHTFEMSLAVNNSIITKFGEELTTESGDNLVYV